MPGFLEEALPAGSRISELLGLEFQNKMALVLGRNFQNWENSGLELVKEKRLEID